LEPTSDSYKIDADQQDPYDQETGWSASIQWVRRQGLEPRTRWLRAGPALCRPLWPRVAPCHFGRLSTSARVSVCRTMPPRNAAAEHPRSTQRAVVSVACEPCPGPWVPVSTLVESANSGPEVLGEFALGVMAAVWPGGTCQHGQERGRRGGPGAGRGPKVSMAPPVQVVSECSHDHPSVSRPLPLFSVRVGVSSCCGLRV